VAPPLLALHGLTKSYGPVRVVDDVSFDVAAGSIHALLGENGAGKSTLIKMLAGVVSIDGGHLEVDGVRHRPASVRAAQSLGIVALPQELTLVPGLDAADNIYLGHRQPGVLGVVDRRRLERDAAAQLARLGQTVPLRIPVGELSAVQQTLVALARALVRDARVLVLDEPTAALTDAETAQLFTVLRGLRDAGTAVVYVSHRLEEVFRLADTVTVLRNGAHVWTKPVDRTGTDDVVRAMIGRSTDEVFARRDATPGAVVLAVDDLHGHRLRGVDLTVREGEVLGVAGLAGSGRSELLRIVGGAQRAAGGRVLLDGVPVSPRSVGRAMAAGIALVPEERRRQGLILSESIQGNIALADPRAVSRLGVASRARERDLARRHVDALRIRARSVRQPVRELSGGNQQKVVLAKYLQRRPRVLLLDEPTRGIDVGTKTEIYALIRALADDGVAVVVVSSEILELLGVADRIAVLHEGRLTATVDARTSDEESVLHHCYGEPAQ
jgi:ribose transport system ATP-binding protein/rhamnose transport system ATP-binding protein